MIIPFGRNANVRIGLLDFMEKKLTFDASIPVQLDYCYEVAKKLKANGIRAEVCHGERLPKLIRNAEMQKVPLMAVVGAKEVETSSITVRSRFIGDVGTMSVDDFIRRTKSAIENIASF